MHDLNFAECVRPTAVRVLKLTLRPYALGHEALLLKERNAVLLMPPAQFAQLPLAQQIFAIKRAALICSQTFAENCGPQKWLRLWGWLTRKADYDLALLDLRNYFAAGRHLPSPPSKLACEVLYGKEDDKGRVMGSPLLAQLYHFACKNPDLFGAFQSSGFKVQGSKFSFQPWDCPYSLTGTLYFASLEMEGRARIENAKEAEEQAAYDKIQEEIAAEQTLSPDSGLKTQDIADGLATPPPEL